MGRKIEIAALLLLGAMAIFLLGFYFGRHSVAGVKITSGFCVKADTQSLRDSEVTYENIDH